MREEIQKKHDRMQADCLLRIRDIRLILKSVEDRIKDAKFPLNDLGEIQGESSKLDCRIATLVTLRKLLDE